MPWTVSDICSYVVERSHWVLHWVILQLLPVTQCISEKISLFFCIFSSRLATDMIDCRWFTYVDYLIGRGKKKSCPESQAWLLINLDKNCSFLSQLIRMTFIVNYSNEIWRAQLGSVDLTQYKGPEKQGIMVMWGRLHRAFLLQSLHSEHWSCKANKTIIIDYNTVLEGFSNHQSILKWITTTFENASQQTRYTVVLDGGKVNSTWTEWFIKLTFKFKKNRND